MKNMCYFCLEKELKCFCCLQLHYDIPRQSLQLLASATLVIIKQQYNTAVYRRLPWSRHSTCSGRCQLSPVDRPTSLQTWPTYQRGRWRHELQRWPTNGFESKRQRFRRTPNWSVVYF